MPRGKYQRKHMQATEGAAEVVAPTSESQGAVRPGASVEAPPAPDPMEQVIGLLQSMSEQIKTLGQRVEMVESNNAPKFIPATPETYSAEFDRRHLIEQAPTDDLQYSQKIPVMSDGVKIPAVFLRDFPARFLDGERVQLNLAAVPHGRSDGKTRGELMGAAGIPNLPGKVVYRTFLTRQREWKYRVQFPRATMPGAVNGTTQFYESELLPL